MNVINEKNSKYIIGVIWCLFFIFLLMQYHQVYLYYDDFGYCSLSYGYDAGIDGTDMNVKSMIDFLVQSYSHINGRIFTNLMLVVAAGLGNLTFMRIFLPISILMIYVLIYKMIITKDVNVKNRIILTIFLCFSYGMFGMNVCKEGFYWFAAAFGYVVPVAFFLYFVRLYRGTTCKWALPILAFILCISSEQMIVMTVVYIFINIILDIYSKIKIKKIYLITFFVAIASAAIMVGSPASRSRMTSESNIEFYSKSLVEKLLFTSSRIIETIGGMNRIFLVLLFVYLSVVSIKMFRKFKYRLVHMLFMFMTLLAFAAYLNGILERHWNSAIKAVIVVYIVFCFIELLIFYWNIDKKLLEIFICAAASVGTMLIMPEIPARTMISFMFMMIYLEADLLVNHVIEDEGEGVILKLGLCVYVLYSGISLATIYQGYLSNAVVLEYNNEQLMKASQEIAANENIESVQLYKLVDDTYAGQQAYYDNVHYILFWMDEFYSLPFELEYVYYDYPSGENAMSIVVY